MTEQRQEKAALRSRVLAARSALSAEERAAAGRLIRDEVLSLAEVQMAGTVAAYYSVGTEPDTRGLVYALWKRGTYVLLPLLRPDGDLDWASYEGPDSLVPGPRGLREPGEPPRGVDAVRRADVVLVLRSRSTGQAVGSAAAAAASTAPWPASARWSRSWRRCMTTNWSPRCPRSRTTCRSAPRSARATASPSWARRNHRRTCVVGYT